MSNYLSILSQIIGWSYFFCWSISFYPQFFINYKLGHIKGYSKEFNILNLSGFLAYFLYSLWGFADPSVIPGVVEIQDLAFSAHAFILTLLLTVQSIWYCPNYFSKIKLWALLIVFSLATSSLIICSLDISNILPQSGSNFNGCMWLGYIKIAITLTKYFPQAAKNYLRKSTKGWSIENILLDFSGGLLSILQILVDGANSGNWNVFGQGGAFNIAKFFIGFTSIIFDAVFMWQHYVLYGDGSDCKYSNDVSIVQYVKI